MAETLRILHYINQFYGGIGGEDKASVGLSTKDGPVGPGMLMKAVLAGRGEIVKTIQGFGGLVIVDEAYSDFSQERPLRFDVDKYPNLIVLNTMSKAWGCAAIRLGMAFAQKDIVDIFNKVKYPYNVNMLTQKQASEALKEPYEVDKWVKIILLERDRMIDAFGFLPCCKKIYPTNANFFLAKFDNAQAVYDYLKAKGIIVRNRTRVTLCEDCLRITIGSKSENNELLSALRQY